MRRLRVRGPRTAVYLAFGWKAELRSLPNDPDPHTTDSAVLRPMIDPTVTKCGREPFAAWTAEPVIRPTSQGPRRSPKFGASVHQVRGILAPSRQSVSNTWRTLSWDQRGFPEAAVSAAAAAEIRSPTSVARCTLARRVGLM